MPAALSAISISVRKLLAANASVLFRFGSRVDVYVPLNSEVLVFVGQKVRAADTVLALLNPQEEEKPETPVEAPAVEAVEVTEVAATADAAPAAETKTTEEKTQQQA